MKAETSASSLTNSNSSRHSRTHWLLLTGVLALAVVLRIYAIGRESIWIDEAFSAFEANAPWSRFLPDWRLLEDTPPLYFTLLHFWRSVFGTSEVALRSLSAIAGVGGVAAIYALARALANARAGLIAAFLLTISPFHVAYSQEARAYSLFFLLTLLSMHGYWLALFTRSSPRKTAYYFASTLGLVWTHYNGVFVVTAQLVHLGLAILTTRERAPLLKRAWKPGAVIIAGFVPLVLVALPSLQRIRHEWWVTEPSLMALVETFGKFTGALDQWQAWGSYARFLTVAFVLLAVNAIIPSDLDGLNNAKANDGRRSWNRLVLLLALGLVPVVIPFVVSKLTTPIYIDRALIPALGGLLILVALGISRLRSRHLRLALLLIILASTAISLRADYSLRTKTDWREAVRFVDEQRRTSSSHVLVYPQLNIYPANYYARQRRLHLSPVVSPLPGRRTLKRLTGSEAEAWLLTDKRLWTEEGRELAMRLLDLYGSHESYLFTWGVCATHFSKTLKSSSIGAFTAKTSFRILAQTSSPQPPACLPN